MKRDLLRSVATDQASTPAAGAIMGIADGLYQFLVPHLASSAPCSGPAPMKGIKVIGHAITLAGGTKGIAVAAYDHSHGTLDELIFDPKTYLYIGDSQISRSATSTCRREP